MKEVLNLGRQLFPSWGDSTPGVYERRARCPDSLLSRRNPRIDEAGNHPASILLERVSSSATTRVAS